MLKVWDLQTGREERTLTGHGGPVRAVAVTPDGRRAVSASSDQTVKVWDIPSGQELAGIALDGHLDCLALAPDGATIVAGDRAGSVYCLRHVDPNTSFRTHHRDPGYEDRSALFYRWFPWLPRRGPRAG